MCVLKFVVSQDLSYIFAKIGGWVPIVAQTLRLDDFRYNLFAIRIPGTTKWSLGSLAVCSLLAATAAPPPNLRGRFSHFLGIFLLGIHFGQIPAATGAFSALQNQKKRRENRRGRRRRRKRRKAWPSQVLFEQGSGLPGQGLSLLFYTRHNKNSILKSG